MKRLIWTIITRVGVGSALGWGALSVRLEHPLAALYCALFAGANLAMICADLERYLREETEQLFLETKAELNYIITGERE